MPGKEDKNFDNLIELAGVIVFIILISLWFNNRSKFYIYLALILFLAAVIVFAAKKISKARFKKVNEWHTDRELINKLRQMPPAEFEDYIADLYDSLGYKTEVVGGSHDGGIDVIAKKNNITYFIQCKKFITAKVAWPDVRDFYGALADHLFGAKGIFITTNVFTPEAEQFARDKPIELIDSDGLVGLIKLSQENKKAIVQGGLLCPKCKGRLLERIGKHGSFLRCENFPVCMYTEKIKE